MITPYKGHVLIKQDPKDTEEDHHGFLVNSRNTKRVHLAWAIVEKVGPDCDEAITEGARVAHNPFDGYDIEEEGVTYAIVPNVGVHAIRLSTPLSTPPVPAW